MATPETSRARWAQVDSRAVLDACDRVLGAASMLLVVIAVICWLRGQTSGLTVALLVLLPAVNLTWTQLGRFGRARAEAGRLITNAPLIGAIHALGDGALQGLWIPSLMAAAGCAVTWPAVTRDVRYGHAAVLWNIGVLALAAWLGEQPFVLTLWRCVAIAVLGFILATTMERLGLALMLARNQQAAAEHNERGLRLVLDSVAQGFITIDRDGVMVGERSSIVDAWFGPAGDEPTFTALLARHDPVVASWFELGLQGLRDGFLPPEVCLEQLPRRVVAGGRTFEIEVRPIVRDEDRLVVIVSDVTEQIERRRAERAQRETVALFQRATADRAGFDEFVDEATALVAALGAAGDPEVERRALHTLKGTCAVYGLDGFVERCHRIEQDLLDTGDALTAAQRAELTTAWREWTAQVQRLLGDRRRNVVDVEAAELAQAIDRARSGAPGRELAPVLASWWHEPAARRLERLGAYATSLARRLGKGELDVEVAAGGIRLDAERWAPFWSALVHAVRNAVDHGLDDADARAAAGKPARPRLALTAHRAGGVLSIVVADDGAGVDWERVRDRARARGLPASTQAELEQAVFADGLSTRDAATTTSGRGVGMAALRAAAEDLGGAVELHSRRGEGTILRFRFPERARSRPTSQARALA